MEKDRRARPLMLSAGLNMIFNSPLQFGNPYGFCSAPSDGLDDQMASFLWISLFQYLRRALIFPPLPFDLLKARRRVT